MLHEGHERGQLVGRRVRTGIKNRHPTTKTLADAEYSAALLEKLSKEVEELRTASVDGRLEEAADVHEVLLALLALSGLTQDDLVAAAAAAAAKRANRGGFERRIWLDAQ